MSRIFMIHKNPYDNVNIYKQSKIIIRPGVTILVGCNGMGKTTLLNMIQEKLEKENLPVILFNNNIEGGNAAMQKALLNANINFLMNLVTSSEGEQIHLNIAAMAEKIGKFVRNNEQAKELWILFDAVDSGMSIDNVVEIKELLFKTILNDCKDKRDVYIICSANTYELCNEENCFDVLAGEYLRFNSYEDYRNFILNSRKNKDSRYNSKN